MPPLIVTGRTGACGNTKRIAGHSGPQQLGHDRREVVAVGAQAMQPDDGPDRARAGLLLYGFQHRLGLGSGPVIRPAMSQPGKRELLTQRTSPVAGDDSHLERVVGPVVS